MKRIKHPLFGNWPLGRFNEELPVLRARADADRIAYRPDHKHEYEVTVWPNRASMLKACDMTDTGLGARRMKPIVA